MLIVESAFHLSVLVSENSKAHAIRDLLEYTYTTTRAVSTKQSIAEYIYELSEGLVYSKQTNMRKRPMAQTLTAKSKREDHMATMH